VPKTRDLDALKARVWAFVESYDWGEEGQSLFGCYDVHTRHPTVEADDAQQLDEDLQVFFSKRKHIIAAIGEVDESDFGKIREAVNDSCLSDKAKKAIGKAMGVTFDKD
jgi:hypothetical protein